MPDRVRLEVVGYWRGQVALVRLLHIASVSLAQREVAAITEVVPVRYQLTSGRVTHENTSANITGDWPATWEVRQLQHIGLFLAFLVDRALSRGAAHEAAAVRTSVRFAWPPTEQLIEYVQALELARSTLGPVLTATERNQLQDVLGTANAWLHR